MKAHVIAIGSELLLGDNVDTNSAWISGRLAEIGVQVVRHTSVGDGVAEMAEVIGAAVLQADVVVTTGGLGPTVDDLTKVALARVAGVELQRDQAMVEEISAVFAANGYEMTANNRRQADLPEGGWWLSRVGTAPGVGLDVGKSVVFCLPGVPREMRVMVTNDVVPQLAARTDALVTVSRTVRTTGVGESWIDERLAGIAQEIEAEGTVTLALLASKGETRVKLTSTAPSRDEALSVLEPLALRVGALVGEGVVGFDDEGVESDIGRRLTDAGMTVAVAESVTGGGVGARLVTVPGASAWFRGGLVTYATSTKVGLAGLDSSRLETQGPVSESTALALAQAAADRLEADIGLSVVGVAGPEPQGGQPVGTLWVATAGPDGSLRAREFSVPARERTALQELAVARSLSTLHRFVRRLTAF